ncbi:transporter substrate-binding domain-containing protein [Thermodesulfobacteriota bacterium]
MNKTARFTSIAIFLIFAILISGGSLTSALSAEKFLIGTSADYPPFEWVDEKGDLVGFDMDVMRIIAMIEGYEAEIKDMSFDSLIPALQSGKIDIAAGLQINKERAKVIDSSNPYIEILMGVAVRKDSDLNIISAFDKGRKVGAQRGTAQAKWVQKKCIEKGVDVKLEVYETNDLAVMDLVNGRLDGYIANTIPLKEFVRNNPIRVSGVIYDLRANFAYLVKKGDPKKLLPHLNGGLKKLEGDAWNNLLDAYFSGDVKKVTDCRGKFGHYLTKEKDVSAYAENMKQCMTAK